MLGMMKNVKEIDTIMYLVFKPTQSVFIILNNVCSKNRL